MTAAKKITLSSSRDIPFNRLVLSQANVRNIDSGVSNEELAEDIARRTLLQSLNMRPILDAEGKETGGYEIPAGGRRYRALQLLVKQKRLSRTALARARSASATDMKREFDVAIYPIMQTYRTQTPAQHWRRFIRLFATKTAVKDGLARPAPAHAACPLQPFDACDRQPRLVWFMKLVGCWQRTWFATVRQTSLRHSRSIRPAPASRASSC
jgi:hypothetical protein